MSVKFYVNLSVWSTTQYGDGIKTMTFYNKHQEIRITIFSAETKFDLILSSPDDECFQIITLFLVSAQYISNSLKKRITCRVHTVHLIS